MAQRKMTVEMLEVLMVMKNHGQTDNECSKYFQLFVGTIKRWVKKLRVANKIKPAKKGSRSSININEI